MKSRPRALGRHLASVVMLAALAFAIANQLWILAVGAGLFVALQLAGAVFNLARRAQKQPRPHVNIISTLLRSRAQRIFVVIVLGVIPGVVWAVAAEGWGVTKGAGPLLAVLVIWLVLVVRREGWWGDKTGRD